MHETASAIAEIPTTDRRRDCPWWCTASHKLDVDRDHTGAEVTVPAVYEQRSATDRPSLLVYPSMSANDDGAAFAPLVSLACGVHADLTEDQAHRLILAIASVLAQVDPTVGPRDHDCPPWCVVPAERHGHERHQWAGGAVHWSRPLVGDGDHNDVRLASATTRIGATHELTVHVGPNDISPAQARRLALDLLHAAALADIAEEDVGRVTRGS